MFKKEEQEMDTTTTTTIKIETNSFNARRYSKPWIARVTFGADGKAQYAWGDWVGTVTSGNGSAGTLVIAVKDGDIVAAGQKDHRGGNTAIDYYQVRDGALVALPGGKAEAYALAAA